MTTMLDGGVLTTPAVLDRTARALPDHLALITEDRGLSFAALRTAARRAAAAMMARGVQPGDRVAIWSANSWHWLVSCLGVHYAGAVLVPVNTHLTGAEAVDILFRSRVRLLVAGVDQVARIDGSALPELVDIVRVPPGGEDPEWTELLDGPGVPLCDVDERAAAVSPDDVADILFTSGTTGRPKGVVCAHRQSLSASASAAECRGLLPADRYLCLSPFFHAFGYKGGILNCLLSGSTLLAQRAFDPERILRVIADQRVTVLPGAPALFQILLDHPNRSAYDLSSLRLTSIGGAPVPPPLIERILTELGVESARSGYGLTEASGYGTASWPESDPATVATTCGRPIAGFELRIDGGGGGDAPGEILLRGPNVMLGYLDDPAATAQVIDADGWLHTGDVGTVDALGNLRITDRLTDMYISGGVNVYPAEVEQAIAGHDAVTQCAVIGVPDPGLGEVGRAFVVVRPDKRLDEQTVIAYARTLLAGYKVPRSVVLLEELPRNASGKVLKTALRQIAYAPPPPVVPQGLGGAPVGYVESWVADAWQQLLHIERPGRRDNFTDLGGDSLAAMEFSRMLSTQFGVSMSVDSLAERPTIAAVVAGLESGGGHQRQPVVRLRADDAGPVCLLIPGIGGHAWRFTALARALSVPCDVRALSLMDVREGPADELRARIRMAALGELRPEATSGRAVVVAGYSFGCLIAADLTCWLVEQGVAVEKLVLLDPDPVESRAGSWDPSTSGNKPDFLTFAPGSPAARQLENEIAEVSGLLQATYLDGSVRLPDAPVSWLQGEKMEIKHRSAPTLFGTPASSVPKTVLGLGHLGMLQVPQVYELARWLDGQLRSTPV